MTTTKTSLLILYIYIYICMYLFVLHDDCTIYIILIDPLNSLKRYNAFSAAYINGWWNKY